MSNLKQTEPNVSKDDPPVFKKLNSDQPLLSADAFPYPSSCAAVTGVTFATLAHL